jgi:cell division septation protein DedD
VIKAPASKPVEAMPPRVLRKVPAVNAPAPTPLPANGRIVTARSIGAAACQGATGTITRIVNGQTLTVRCGPQETAHVTVVRRGELPGSGKTVYSNPGWQNPSSPSAQTRIVPRHVYESRDDQVVMIPEGYRPAWSDDRLNRYRAVQTIDGYLATQEVWTNKVPRKLVAQTGKPAKIKQPVIAYRATSKLAPVVSTQGTTSKIKKTPVVSTKSAPRKPAAGAKWVEIGVFTSLSKAQAAANRLQRAGLPVKFGVFRKGGTEYRRVLVGPFASAQAINAALGKVRRVGYTSAYLR